MANNPASSSGTPAGGEPAGGEPAGGAGWTTTPLPQMPVDLYRRITEALKGPAADDPDAAKKRWRIPGPVSR